MAKASRRLPNLADKQLAGVAPAVAKRKWREGLPVSLKQMAVALEVGYSAVRSYSKMPGFPMLKGFVHPRHFDRWLDECFRAQSAGAAPPPIAESPLPRHIAQSQSSTLPLQAQKLLKDAGVRP
jgi:hypothetical protein